jgi:hypothetical protein
VARLAPGHVPVGNDEAANHKSEQKIHFRASCARIVTRSLQEGRVEAAQRIVAVPGCRLSNSHRRLNPVKRGKSRLIVAKNSRTLVGRYRPRGLSFATISYTIIKEVNPDGVKGSATGGTNFFVLVMSAFAAPIFGWFLHHLADSGALRLQVFEKSGSMLIAANRGGSSRRHLPQGIRLSYSCFALAFQQQTTHVTLFLSTAFASSPTYARGDSLKRTGMLCETHRCRMLRNDLGRFAKIYSTDLPH